MRPHRPWGHGGHWRPYAPNSAGGASDSPRTTRPCPVRPPGRHDPRGRRVLGPGRRSPPRQPRWRGQSLGPAARYRALRDRCARERLGQRSLTLPCAGIGSVETTGTGQIAEGKGGRTAQSSRPPKAHHREWGGGFPTATVKVAFCPLLCYSISNSRRKPTGHRCLKYLCFGGCVGKKRPARKSVDARSLRIFVAGSSPETVNACGAEGSG